MKSEILYSAGIYFLYGIYIHDKQVVTHKLFPCIFCLTNWIMDDMLFAAVITLRMRQYLSRKQ